MMLPLVVLVMAAVFYGIWKRKGGIVYAAFAVLAAFGALIPFGYALIHGGEELLLAIPLGVVVLFAMSYGIYRVTRLPVWLRRGVLWLPVILIVVPVVSYLFVVPQYQKMIYKQKLSKVSFDHVDVRSILLPTGQAVGLHVEYDMIVPEALHVPQHSLDFSPIKFPEPSVGLATTPPKSLSGVIIVSRNGQQVEDYFTDFPAGMYHVVFNGLVDGVRGADTNYCLAYASPPLSVMPEGEALESVLEVNARVDIPKRMGIFYEKLFTQPLPLKFNLAAAMKAAQALPTCTE